MFVNLSLYDTTVAPIHLLDFKTTGEKLMGERKEQSLQDQAGRFPKSIY